MLKFKDLSFIEEKDRIKLIFLKIFYSYIAKSSLKKISDFTITKNSITFKKIPENKAETKFNFLLQDSFKNLKNKLNDNKTIYIHKNSAIPLIGSLSFGIVDKGSKMIELKPITGCNINCIFCSVDEGLSSKKMVDYIVEKDYLMQELKKLVEFKATKVDIYINPHGEPLLYADIVPLVNDISKIKNVNIISIITNGTLLTKDLIDKLIGAGLNRINISINALDQKLANKLAGSHYNVKHLLEMLYYLNKKIELVLTPVYLPEISDNEIIKLIELSKKLSCKIAIQNFQTNKRGRNPTKQLSWDRFYSKLKSFEKGYNIELIPKKIPINTKEYKMPFNKGDIIKPEIILPGRYPNEKIAVSQDRSITVTDCYKNPSKIKITRSMHNIFYATSI
jgi:uncharacterized Fe-S cluster-containing radical SAM superfamily enzyme